MSGKIVTIGDEICYIDESHSKAYKILQTKSLFFYLYFVLFFIATTFAGVSFTLLHKAAPQRIEAKEILVTPTPANQYVLAEEKQRNQTIGFLPAWNMDQAKDIPVDKLSQLVYFGISANESGVLSKKSADSKDTFDWYQFQSQQFKDTVQRFHSHNKKVLLGIKNFNTLSLNALKKNPGATSRLADDVAQVVAENGLDGVNIDFEYFNYWDDELTSYITALLQSIARSLKTVDPNYLLTIDVNAGVVLSEKAYDLTKIGTIVDQLVLMGYDYHRAASTQAGPVAPLYGPSDKQTISRSIIALFGKVPPEKIILSIPLYGYEWQTKDEAFGSEVIPGTARTLTYSQIKQMLQTQKTMQTFWDYESKSPWITYRDDDKIKQIYYENEQSIQQKVQFVNNQALGGIALWTLGYEGKNPEIWESITTNNQ